METRNSGKDLFTPNGSQLLEDLCLADGMDLNKGWERLDDRLFRKPRSVQAGMWAAAVIVIIIVLAIGLLSPKEGQEQALHSPIVAGSFLPILRHEALLMMDNGQEVTLGVSDTDRSLPAGHSNTVTTFRAGHFKITLPDGTKVWLNNDSRLYQSAFTANSREVELTGEAYFEIAEDIGRPFKVRVKNIAVEVIGTRFNVMGYPDDTVVKTTLYQGKLTVKAGKQALTVIPGEQVIKRDSGQMEITRPEALDDTSWINGRYKLEAQMGLKDVLKQLSRWYDIDLRYETVIDPEPVYHVPKGVDKKTTLDAILKYLQEDLADSIHFSIKDNVLIVSH